MIHLKVVSPKGIAFEEDVISATLPLEKGPTMIEGGCTPLMVSTDSIGILKVVKKGRIHFFVLFPFIANINQTSIEIITDRLENGSAIDMAKAKVKLEHYQEILKKETDSQQIKYIKNKVTKNLLRIRAKDLSEGSK